MESSKDTGKNVEVNIYQEALDYMKRANHFFEGLNPLSSVRSSTHIHNIQELVDKVKPQEPRCYWDNDNDLYKYDCPNCYKQLTKHSESTKLSKIKKPNFCSNCGCKIDWSKDE